MGNKEDTSMVESEDSPISHNGAPPEHHKKTSKRWEHNNEYSSTDESEDSPNSHDGVLRTDHKQVPKRVANIGLEVNKGGTKRSKTALEPNMEQPTAGPSQVQTPVERLPRYTRARAKTNK